MMTPEDQEAIANVIAAQMGAAAIANNFGIYAVIAALAEQGLISQERVITWALTFAEIFEKDARHPDANKQAAAHLRDFAANLRTISTVPAGAGRA